VATDRTALQDATRRTAAAGITAQLVEYVPGPGRRVVCVVTFVGTDGEPSEPICYRKLRHAPPRFGVASVAELVACRDLVEPTRALLSELRWRGPAALEFKLDARDGSYRFLEINGRSVLPNQLLRQAGYPFARAQWCQSLGQAWHPEPNGWRGRWIHLHADLATRLLGSRRSSPTWREFWHPYSGPKVFAVWSPSDPGPFLAQWRRSLIDSLRLPFRPEQRHELRRRVELPPGL